MSGADDAWLDWTSRVLHHELADDQSIEQEEFPGTQAYVEQNRAIDRADAPVTEALRSVGADLERLWLFEATTRAEAEVLLEHLALPHTRLTREHVAMSLMTPAARPFVERFVALMRHGAAEQACLDSDSYTSAHYYADTAANLISAAKPGRARLVELIDDPSLGPSRIILMHGFGPKRHGEDLRRWLADPDLAGEADRHLRGRTET